MPDSERAGVEVTVVSGLVSCCAIAARRDMHHDTTNHTRRVEFIGFSRDDVQELREGSPQGIYGSPWERASRETDMGDFWCGKCCGLAVKNMVSLHQTDAQ